MVHNVLGIRAGAADGSDVSFGPVDLASRRDAAIGAFVHDLAATHRSEVVARWPKVQRRVGGYNLAFRGYLRLQDAVVAVLLVAWGGRLCRPGAFWRRYFSHLSSVRSNSPLALLRCSQVSTQAFIAVSPRGSNQPISPY